MNFNSPPGWPAPPEGWSPPAGWRPQPDWPSAPEGWPFWTDDAGQPVDGPQVEMHHEAAPLVVAPSNGGLWAFVGVQVALVVLDVIMLRIGVSPVGVSLVVGGVLNLACLIFDVWSLRMVGHSVPVYLYVLGFLIVPLYIIFRIRLTKQSWWPLAAWVVVFVVGIAATPFLGGVELDSDAVETSIEEVYRDEGTTVTVDCPATLAVPVGDTFACGVDGLDSDVDQLTITVDNWLGDISWLESDLGKGA